MKAKGASLRATERPFNTGDIYGELTVNLLGCFAQFETAIRKERQLEGIAKAKVAGVYKGRKRSIDIDAVRTLKAEGIGPAAIAKRLGVARASVYRAWRRFKATTCLTARSLFRSDDVGACGLQGGKSAPF